ncbi:hypothetical protein AQ490_04220 [Wenjunlia vitaminophila]|uniref:N,N-dimethylformamidase beta subunit-like C-terminal domain-containing protein n=1 Tax=Wenjunlia vitaminophila TaxID=76728 RepID=A0A0T6LQS8_WENVI|nr:hypothetical protein AQ490_04220 [Wenjunlia vitaminophila]
MLWLDVDVDVTGNGPVDRRAGRGGFVGDGQTPGRRTDPWTAQAGAGGRIEGFASDGAVAPGEAVDFRITVDPPREFRVDVYRVGHYGGAGAHRLTASPTLPGMVQPEPLVAGRTVSCHHWWRSWRLPVPPSWRCGAYVAQLTTVDGARGHVPFTVRSLPPAGEPGPEEPTAATSPPVADLLVVLPDITWQAYNSYPEQELPPGVRDAPMTVSFDRPYAGTGVPPFAGHAHGFIRWAERYGYDLAYAEARDLHAGRVAASHYRGLVFPGHDEYWTAPMRAAVREARDQGTSLVFLSAGSLAGHADLDPSPSGEPHRLLTCRGRRRHRGGSGREAGDPEQALLGIQHAGPVPEPAPLVVRNAGHWLWEATGAEEGDLLPGLVAGCADRYFPRTSLPEYRERILLTHSPYRDARGARRHQETSLYRAPSGALVFASGTSAWSPALDRSGRAESTVQRATANLLDRICKGD